MALRSAYSRTRLPHHVTVLAATGDSGVADVGLNRVTYLHPPGGVLATQ